MSNELLGSHVKQLLSGVSDHGISHLQEIEGDLVQITALLSDAIRDLGTSFLDLHAALKLQESLIKKNLDDGSISTDNKVQFNIIQSEIEMHINESVRNLQFQDLTSQLVSRTVKRSTGLRDLLCTINLVGNDIQQDSAHSEIVLLLKEVSSKLALQSIELKNLLRKTVSQKNLGSGDIELF
jgi:hypothetical protein